MKDSKIRAQAGFSLIETVVAAALLAAALVSLAGLFAVAARSNATARAGSLATMLAGQKMEQLRALVWGFDAVGLPIGDTSTDTSVCPESSIGGTGLAPSTSNTLYVNTNGYVDYLDGNGVQLGGGATVPSGTVFVRRWSIQPLPANPDNTLIVQVLVTRRLDQGAGDPGAAARMPEEARLVTVRTRKKP